VASILIIKQKSKAEQNYLQQINHMQQVMPGAASIAACLIAGCRHMVGVIVWSQSHCSSALKV